MEYYEHAWKFVVKKSKIIVKFLKIREKLCFGDILGSLWQIKIFQKNQKPVSISVSVFMQTMTKI